MSDLKFIETNASEIYEIVIGALEKGCNEDLYPGDERRIFGEAMVPLVVALFNAVNDAAMGVSDGAVKIKEELFH